jgi:hypothetical protein
MSEELKNLPKALCTGDDTFNGVKLVAAILDDEDRTHLFSESSLAKAFGFKGSATYWEKRKKGTAVLPSYLSNSALKDYITADLIDKLATAVPYLSTSKVVSTGIEATALPLICDVFVRAGNDNPDNEALVTAGKRAYAIILAFSQFGVLKWVEQITGYRYTDEDTQIVKSLKEYGVSPTIVEWQREFQSEFYRHIYRLKGWPYNPNTTARPQVIGTYTNQYVYNYLPKDVFAWIKENTPKSKAGNKTAKYFQSLDDKIGKEKLRNQMVSVTMLLKLSRSWLEFKQYFARSLGQTQIDFKEPDMIIPQNKLIERVKKDHGQFDLFGNEKEKLSDFNNKLKTALNYNPKDNH